MDFRSATFFGGWVAGRRSRAVWDFRSAAERTLVAGVSSRLWAGTESDRVSVVALETARVAELLPHYFRTVEPLRTPGASSRVQPAILGVIQAW